MATNRERTVNRDQVTAALNAAFAAYPLDDLLPRLAELGIPAGEVRTIDRVYDWDQTRSQGLVLDVDHPVLGRIEMPGPPIRFDDNAYAGGRSEHVAPADAGPARREHPRLARRAGRNARAEPADGLSPGAASSSRRSRGKAP